MIGMAIFFVLPLSMLRQLDSLSFICTASLIFYSCVTLFIMSTAKENIFHSDWSSNVQWWRPAGIFKCLPIFCMGLSCHPQVFEVRAELSRHSESTPPPSKMNRYGHLLVQNFIIRSVDCNHLSRLNLTQVAPSINGVSRIRKNKVFDTVLYANRFKQFFLVSIELLAMLS